MNLYNVLIPVQDNDKKLFPDSLFKRFELSLLESFGGYSKASSNNIGAWKDNNQIYYDYTIQYQIAGNLNKIKSILEEYNKYFRQESFFIVLVSNNVVFFNPKKIREKSI